MINYVELHCHSCYSLLDGASTPAELVNRAADLGMEALAITDHNAVYGAIPFLTAAQARGIRPIFGAEMTLEDGHHLTLLVADARGWRSLCTLISRAQANAPKGHAALPWEALATGNDGLICLSGCRRGPVAAALRRWDRTAAFQAAKRLKAWFGPERCWIELQHHLHPKDALLVRDLVDLARHLQLGYVTTNNVHYARRDQQPIADVLAAIRYRVPMTATETRLRPNNEYYLKSAARLLPLFPAYPDALANSRRIAGLCDFTPCFGLQDLPRFPIPPGSDADSYLAQLCVQALSLRYSDVPERAQRQLEHELGIIGRAKLANYFLIVWDVVRFARTQGIRCQGRGSAANSLVAYLLGISPIDPLAHNLTFERFLSDERPALPDIDVDFAADRREEAVQYVFEKYGRDCVAMACTFSTFQERQALRDVAFALDLPLDRLREPSDGHDPSRALAEYLSGQIQHLPRHLGQHNGGMILTAAPLCERVATEPAAMPGRVVVQWDKDALETAGLIKIDVLGLRMLAALSEAERLLAEQGTLVALDRLPFDDPAVYEMVSRSDTLGVFQVESSAQASMLPKLQPRVFADLLVAISLIRPGPLQGNMVHPYLRRRQGLEPVRYAHPCLQPVLQETLGVLLYQEQVLQVGQALAGFTAGEGELLRRTLGKGDADAIAALKARFLAGAVARGVSQPVAERVFEQLAAFGSYAFAKSHAAAFAVLVYQSAWLKRYHPAALLCAILNNEPMGYWPPAILVRDARRHDVRVWPLDINASNDRCICCDSGVRMGFRYVAGLGTSGISRILQARQAGPFTSVADCAARTALARPSLEQLVAAGAFDRFGQDRRALLWEVGRLQYAPDELDLPIPASPVELPALSDAEKHWLEQRALGISTSEHPLAHWRDALARQGYTNTWEITTTAAGQQVRLIASVVVLQTPPTAHGFAFITAEDEFGLVQVILRPTLARGARLPRQTGTLIEVEGVVQREGGVVNLLATRVAQRKR